MNILAHAYLSFSNPDLIAGNLFCDFIKGKRQYMYPAIIQKGFALHRAIDLFTDQHEATIEARQIFKPSVRLYASAFLDIAYDHFLACDINEKSEEEWKMFAKRTYAQLNLSKYLYPKKFARVFPLMRMQNWLYNYRHKWLIRNSFYALAFRASYLHFNDGGKAFAAFLQEYDLLQDCYNRFFPELKEFAINFVKTELELIEN